MYLAVTMHLVLKLLTLFRNSSYYLVLTKASPLKKHGQFFQVTGAKTKLGYLVLVHFWPEELFIIFGFVGSQPKVLLLKFKAHRIQ
jgi:hypothetical protein